MKFSVSTHVPQSPPLVWSKFDADLFKALAPPFPPVRLLRFDGSEKGNEVHLELNFLIFKQIWISRISEHEYAKKEIFFVDEGIKLPFFLSYWRHKHRLVADSHFRSTYIVDEVEYKTPFWLTDLLMWLPLYLQFLYRVPIYKRCFPINVD